MSNYIKRHITKNCTSYVPVNIDKYRGRPPIICRSSWEEAFCKFADFSNGIVEWASEEIVIQYQDPINPIDKRGKPKFRKYYPDFVIKTTSGEIYLIEVKPLRETKPPARTGRKSTKTLMTEEKNWRTNSAKWKAARSYCSRKGWTFKIITERELFGKR